MRPDRALTLVDVVAPLVVALLFVAAMSRVRDPHRQSFNAILVAGAGDAYLGGGLGWWEFGFTTVATVVAQNYQKLPFYRYLESADSNAIDDEFEAEKSHVEHEDSRHTDCRGVSNPS